MFILINVKNVETVQHLSLEKRWPKVGLVGSHQKGGRSAATSFGVNLHFFTVKFK